VLKLTHHPTRALGVEFRLLVPIRLGPVPTASPDTIARLDVVAGLGEDRAGDEGQMVVSDGPTNRAQSCRIRALAEALVIAPDRMLGAWALATFRSELLVARLVSLGP